jgi:hypothetical protein
MTDLEYLAAEAFEFDLEINPGAGAFVPVSQILEERQPDDDEWVSLDQRAEAIKTNKLCVGQVYPNGSVGFFLVYGVNVSQVVARCAELCKNDKARYQRSVHNS